MVNTAKEKNEYDADVAVVGGGGSGLMAALAAAERGARVIVLEKRNPGGNAAMARGFFAAESAFQKRSLIDAPRDMAFKIAMSYNHLNIDARLMRAFIDKSGETAGWLESKGVVIDFVTALYPNQQPLTWHVIRGGGIQMIKILKKCCAEMNVQILPHTEVRQLLREDNGKVVGVSATRKGTNITVSAPHVILATGGYDNILFTIGDL